MKTMGRWLSLCLTGMLIAAASSVRLEAQYKSYANYPEDPDHVVRLVFVHHSTGEHWLADNWGGLGLALMNSGYFVSDTNYGWGPDSIGDHTDIGNWWTWFRGASSAKYLAALYAESEQHYERSFSDSEYSRLATKPSGTNQVVMFKSCFPNSALKGKTSDAVPAIGANPLRGQSADSAYHTVANAKGIYIDLLNYFKTRQDKLFVVIAAPPLSDKTYAANARAFNQWLVNDWLADYPYRNVFVFDYYNVHTSNGGSADKSDLYATTGNHHRWRKGVVEHVVASSGNVLAYPSGDDHPSQAGNQKATAEFVKLLDYAYDRWQDLNGALDNSALTFTSGGNNAWFPESVTGYWSTGGSAAQSGAIGNSQSSWVQTTVTGPGTLKFRWRVSSQSSDSLKLLIDGQESKKISGSTAWAEVSTTIGSGAHTLRWSYLKDASGAAGLDAGWLDQVRWTAQ